MKRIAFAIAALITLSLSIILNSCETDIDVSADWKDITVVYGLMDQQDSVHYLRINKAFLGDGSALEYAKEPDSSSYFNNLEVTLTQTGPNGKKVFTYDTIHVSNKDSGIFYSPSQILYRSNFIIPEDINEGNDYKYDLLIRNKITGKEIKAATQIVNDFKISTPRYGQPSIDFITDNNQKIEWTSAKNGKRYDVSIRFWFQEVLNNSNDTIDRYIDWQLGSMKSGSLSGGEEMTMLYKPNALYDVAKVLIPRKDGTESNVKARLTNKTDFIIIVAGDELNTYIEVNTPSSGIIQDTPDYSNIENGLGLFSSRYTGVRTIPVGAKTEAKFMAINELKFVDKIGN